MAEYFCGGWVEEYVFLKFTGTLAPSQYTLGCPPPTAPAKPRTKSTALPWRTTAPSSSSAKPKKQDQAQDAIYKLGQLVRQVGGLMARGLYVSARPVSDTDRARAKEYGVDVLAGEELASLSDYLRNWKDNAAARP